MPNNIKLQNFIRQCKVCGNCFKTKGRYSRICDACRLENETKRKKLKK